MTTSAAPAVTAPASDETQGRDSLAVLALGAIGVVYGDLGTSPIYAFREAIHAAAEGGLLREEVLGIVSLTLWAMTIIITLKYVLFVMRMDNGGEGGNLALMALAQKARGRRARAVLVLGVLGAALFYGDALLTPAISVLSAVEGLKVAAPGFDERFIVPIALVIIVGLFAVQKRGTGRIGAWFGPILTVWFLTLALLGVVNLMADPGILAAFNPVHGAIFLGTHGMTAFLVLGLVFLTLTGAEALYADMGHFGRKAISLAWLGLVFPALGLNYLGQGALVLSAPAAAENPFFKMAPDWFIWPFVVLTVMATVIASQSIITGAFSLTQQAIQLGLVPGLRIRFTSETRRGQIYLPTLNALLFVGVVALVLAFRTSSNLAGAYGVAVTGAMLATTSLAFVVLRHLWGWTLAKALLVIAPLAAIELSFLIANLLKIEHGGWFPLLFGAILMFLMFTWVRGRRILSVKLRRQAIPLTEFARHLAEKPPTRVHGTAVFVTADVRLAPVALVHNLKHNHVLHERNIIVSVATADIPYVPEQERVLAEEIEEGFERYEVEFGFMERPNLPALLERWCPKVDGKPLDIENTSFFVGRKTLVPSHSGMPLWQDRIFIAMAAMSLNPADYFGIPRDRAVEIGSQVAV